MRAVRASSRLTSSRGCGVSRVPRAATRLAALFAAALASACASAPTLRPRRRPGRWRWSSARRTAPRTPISSASRTPGLYDSALLAGTAASPFRRGSRAGRGCPCPVGGPDAHPSPIPLAEPKSAFRGPPGCFPEESQSVSPGGCFRPPHPGFPKWPPIPTILEKSQIGPNPLSKFGRAHPGPLAALIWLLVW